MRFSLSASTAAGFALALSIASARAQTPPPAPPDFTAAFSPMDGPGGPSLLLSASVQEELGLSDKQKSQLKKLQASMMQKSREGLEAARQEGVDPQEIMQGMAGLRREHDLAASRVLDKAQKSRLAQLEMQREGLLAIAKSDVANKIKLTSPQTKKVRTILAEMNQARYKAMPAPPGAGGAPGGAVAPGGAAPGGGVPEGEAPGGGFFGGGFPGGMQDINSEEFRARYAKMMESEKKIRATAGQKIGEVLTKEQNDAFEKLLGKPFDLSKLNPTPQPAGTPEADTPKADGEMPKATTPPKAKSKTRKDRTS